MYKYAQKVRRKNPPHCRAGVKKDADSGLSEECKVFGDWEKTYEKQGINLLINMDGDVRIRIRNYVFDLLCGGIKNAKVFCVGVTYCCHWRDIFVAAYIGLMGYL